MGGTADLASHSDHLAHCLPWTDTICDWVGWLTRRTTRIRRILPPMQSVGTRRASSAKPGSAFARSPASRAKRSSASQSSHKFGALVQFNLFLRRWRIGPEPDAGRPPCSYFWLVRRPVCNLGLVAEIRLSPLLWRLTVRNICVGNMMVRICDAALKSQGSFELDWSYAGINAGERRTAYRPSRRCNVKDYGAAMDGTSDDRDAVQAAVEACGRAGGGSVEIPAGTLRLEGQVKIRYSNVILRGAGREQDDHLHTSFVGVLQSEAQVEQNEQRTYIFQIERVLGDHRAEEQAG